MNWLRTGNIAINLDQVTDMTWLPESKELVLYFAFVSEKDKTTALVVFKGAEAEAAWRWMCHHSNEPS
jgi:hypothetical protein